MLNGMFSNSKEAVQDNWFCFIPSKAVSMTTQLSNFLSNYARALCYCDLKEIVTELFAQTDMTALAKVRSKTMCQY